MGRMARELACVLHIRHTTISMMHPEVTARYSDAVMEALEAAKRKAPKGGDYWMARAIRPILGYADWDNFEGVVSKAMMACERSGQPANDHFLETTVMMEVGRGAKVRGRDYYVTRYGAYLIAMNGIPSKPQVASAQRYFAVQTRLREIEQMAQTDEERLRLRQRLKEATKSLNSRAGSAGVENFALFAHAGYMGLYSMGLRDIKRRKGIGEKEELFERAGRLELAANEFRATLTERSIAVRGICGQAQAETEHLRVGRAVRETMRREAGVVPEDLRAEPPIRSVKCHPKARSDFSADGDPQPK